MEILEIAAKKIKDESLNLESETKFVVKRNVETRFFDVAGLTEAKEEMMKITDMFKNRERYESLGAKIPTGVMLLGPPGCGKTLLARAVAGESGVPFISVNGAEFDEKLVGVGVARVRKMFETARNIAKSDGACVLFIDEIDALGKVRLIGNTRSSETLNMLLTELDGFDKTLNVMVIAATNIGKSLDPALTRSGRFDHKVYIDPPTKDDRIEMFKLYLEKLTLIKRKDIEYQEYEENEENGDNVKTENTAETNDTVEIENVTDSEAQESEDNEENGEIYEFFILHDLIEKMASTLTRCTPGMTGADISNVCNQAAISAAREGRDCVELSDLMNAIDTIGIGIKKNSRKANEKEIEKVAYHESGHALVGLILKDAESPAKMTIVPRGPGHLGYTMPNVSEDGIYDRNQILAKIMVALGGRVAEKIVFKRITTGAGSDLQAVRKLALQYFTTGLSDHYGNVALLLDPKEENLQFLSDDMRQDLDKQISDLVDNLTNLTERLLSYYVDQLEELSRTLLENETIDFNSVKHDADENDPIYQMMRDYENKRTLEVSDVSDDEFKLNKVHE